ncbi:hypothetical protein H4Q26_007389 [Puccinia striiformis f. sp. tritici PST-130]|nr:hypothetical protein H4Q26_007389 [Puccinia striiformis f. sp. tritici PST-130]
MPLCLEWIDFTPAGIQCEHATRKGSFIAVGTMDPEIEIWNLDVELTTISLSRYDDQIMGFKSISIRASSTFKAIRSFDIHTDKVHRYNGIPRIFNRFKWRLGWNVKVWDSRNANEGVQVKLSSDIECLRWDPFNSQSFIVTLDNGLIQSYDSRMLTQFDSSTKSTPKLYGLSFDISPTIPGLLVSGGLDKLVKVWNLEDKSGSPTLSMVVSRDLGVGKVFSVSFSPDDPTTLAVAGTRILRSGIYLLIMAFVAFLRIDSINSLRSGSRE